MKRTIVLVFWLCGLLFAQNTERIQYYGKVTYISSVNVYVQIESQDGINAGDTLYQVKHGRVPALVIEFLSSKSIAGKKIESVSLNVGDTLVGWRRLAKSSVSNISKNDVSLPDTVSKVKKEFSKRKKELKGFGGRMTLNSYSDFSNLNSVNRYRASISLQSNNAFGPKFAFSTYFTFQYNDKEKQSITASLPKHLKFYDLAATYKIDSESEFILGRYLNKKVVNGGVSDGIQYQKTTNKMTYGFIAGSRPSYNDYSFDFKFFQAGAYFSRIDSIAGEKMENTIAFFHQTNKLKTDREYLYMQNSNMLLPGTQIFASAEIDFYRKILSASSIKPELTGLYFMSRTAIIQKLNFTFSYDARRNVIYYETFKNSIDSTLENELRQGLRASLTYGFGEGISTGVNWGYRFRKSDPRPSKNFGASFSISRLPYVNASLYSSVSQFSGSFINGLNFSGQVGKELLQIVTISAGYRYFRYKFPDNNNPNVQHTYTLDVGLFLTSGFIFSVNFEGVSENTLFTNRIFLDCTYRF